MAISAIRFSRRSARFIPSGIAGLIVSLLMGWVSPRSPCISGRLSGFGTVIGSAQRVDEKDLRRGQRSKICHGEVPKPARGLHEKNSKTGAFIVISALFFCKSTMKKSKNGSLGRLDVIFFDSADSFSDKQPAIKRHKNPARSRRNFGRESLALFPLF